MHTHTRRDFLKIINLGIAVSLIATGLLSSSAFGQDKARRKPNVVILFIDDLGYGDLGCFGNKQTPTPHMDALANEGTRLTMNYVTNAACSPSRCSLITGMYTQRFGKFGMARGHPIPHDHPTLAEFMRDAGYVTGQIGKWDLGSEGQGPHERGFMEVARWAPSTEERTPSGHQKKQPYQCKKPDGSIVYRTDQDGDYMVEFVERNKDKPFFLYFSPFAIHTPLEGVPQHYRDRVRGKNDMYGGAVVAVDDAIGKLRTLLKKLGLEKDTLILLTGDNGPHPHGSAAPYAGGKMGGTQKEGWVHTPGIAWWPETIPAGQTFEGLLCTLDYYATAAAVAEQKLPKRCDGKNLLPYLTNKKKGDVHEFIYWYNAGPYSFRHLSAVRWKNWRLVLNRKKNQWELFDLRKDPLEEKNIAEQHEDVVKTMKLKHENFVSTLPALDAFPKPIRNWAKPPEGWGWVIGDGK